MINHNTSTITVSVDGVQFTLEDLAPMGGMTGTYAVLRSSERIGDVLAHTYPADNAEAVSLVQDLIHNSTQYINPTISETRA